MFSQKILPIAWIALYQIMSFMFGQVHKIEMQDWYPFLNKSVLTPPGYVFGIVWPILYTLLALAGYDLWRYKASRYVRVLYILQMLLNWSWTFVFFGAHLLTLSWIIIAAMILLTLLIMIESFKTIPNVTWLLIPYLVWISFAWYLSFFIWMHN